MRKICLIHQMRRLNFSPFVLDGQQHVVDNIHTSSARGHLFDTVRYAYSNSTKAIV